MTNSVPSTPSSSDHVVGGPPPLPNPNPNPNPHRRPRVKQVASRFMSPAPSPSSSAGDLHSLTMKSPKPSIDRSTKPSPSQRRLLLRGQPPEPFSSQENVPETSRSMETPFQFAQFAKTAQTETRRPRAVKLFKENGYPDQNQIPKSSVLRTSKSSRPDTPSERIVSSRYRQSHRHSSQSSHSTDSSDSVTEAAKLLQSNGLSYSSADNELKSQLESEPIKGGSCPNSPISSRTSVSVTDENTSSSSVRSLVRTSSGSNISGANSQTSSSSSSSLLSSSSSLSSSTPSICSRSLTLPTSGCLSTFKSIDRLPPQPTGANKPGVDGRKAKKAQSSQQDVHTLKMLHNKYLQWRFANAKAEASMHAQSIEAQKQFCSLGSDISNLRDSVKKKRAELAMLQRTKALTTILEAQMPYLDEWSAVEEDYERSLSGATTALTNSLLRLPISGNVQVNIKDAAEAIDSAVKTADMIVHQMQMFLPKAEEMDGLMSELANVIDVEKALVEECGNLLVKTHTLQVEDCSLRGHLMQVASSKTRADDT